jgi:hypothetical protein
MDPLIQGLVPRLYWIHFDVVRFEHAPPRRRPRALRPQGSGPLPIPSGALHGGVQ